jgi:hypothetical protein
MTWETAFAELNTSVVSYFGETVDYVSLDALTTVNDISATLNRGGDDGTAEFNMPVASVAVPAFGDKITDSDAVEWRISEIRQKFSDRTPCILMRSDFWETVDIEYHTSGAWATHTSSVSCLITANSSFEDLDDGFIEETEYTVKTQYLAAPTQKMRFKWGSRYLYITGKRPDESNELTVEWDCSEIES